METIVLAGGCFWCIEAAFNMIRGVQSAVSGYTGGSAANANYEAIETGKTGHAEAVQVTYDPSVISLSEVFDIFWTIHNPTTLNRQGNDVGTEYRSAIFYANDAQKQAAEASIQQVQKLWDDPVVTTLEALGTFYPAEDYHQHFFEKNPTSGYCQVIINPKLQKLRHKFAERIK